MFVGFQEDTFASDSLRHILTLLSSLDTHAFTLLTSLSLSNRSRVKDLWIFTGLAAIETSETSFSDSTGSENVSASNIANRSHNTYDTPAIVGPVPNHKRHPSAPTGGASYPQNQHNAYPQPPPANLHARAATDRAPQPGRIHSPPHSPLPGGVLRKPAPRAQVPISVNLDASLDLDPEEQEQFRAVLPSVVSSGVENMTGVGAIARGGREPEHTPAYTPDVLYTTGPENDYVAMRHTSIPGGPISSPQRSRSGTPPNGRHVRPVSSRAKTPPLLTTLSRPSSPATAPHVGTPTRESTPQQLGKSGAGDRTPTPPLLGSGVFAGDIIRDSAFSSTTDATDTSQEIPIKWTGGAEPELMSSTGKPEGSKLQRMSTGPQLPGAWTTSPDGDDAETVTLGKEVDIETERHADTQPIQDQTSTQQHMASGNQLHDVDARVASPELVLSPGDGMRKSEAGLVGIVSSMPPVQDVGTDPQTLTKREGSGNGWVLVNVEGKPKPEGEGQLGVRPDVLSKNTSAILKESDLKSAPKNPHATTALPVAKSILILDAKDAQKLNKTKGKGKADPKDPGIDRASGLKRLLSFSTRGEVPNEPRSDALLAPGDPTGGPAIKKKPSRTRLRDRLKLIGVTEASPRAMEDKRLSID